VSGAKTRAIILAAGKGVRMKTERPKVLHRVLGRPVVRYVLDSLEEAGVPDVTLVVGYGADELKKALGGSCRYVLQPELKGTADAVERCRKEFKGFSGGVLVLCGDAPFVSTAGIREMISVREKSGAECVLFTADAADPTGYGRIVRDAKGRFLRMAEEIDASGMERGIAEINSGAYCFSAPALFDALGKVEPDNKKGELYLTEVPRILAEQGRKVETVRAADESEVRGINTRRDLADATDVMRRRILERHMDAGVTVVDPRSTFIEPDVEIGPDTIVEPFTILRSGTRIGRGCHVGPFCQLRGGAVLEDGAEIGNFVEVKKSRIGRGSKAKHLAYIGDAELGANVNIGAGTITANYDGKKKHKTVLEDGVQTGSNCVLVAPVVLKKGAKTGAGAVVPKGRVEAGTVVAGVPAKPLKKKTKV
jgi:bifunctional UDP-N-acetylglucosamine pyrophosphorylase/glucosamine-1-phosphate N-acetyltransferase